MSIYEPVEEALRQLRIFCLMNKCNLVLRPLPKNFTHNDTGKRLHVKGKSSDSQYKFLQGRIIVHSEFAKKPIRAIPELRRQSTLENLKTLKTSNSTIDAIQKKLNKIEITEDLLNRFNDPAEKNKATEDIFKLAMISEESMNMVQIERDVLPGRTIVGFNDANGETIKDATGEPLVFEKKDDQFYELNFDGTQKEKEPFTLPHAYTVIPIKEIVQPKIGLEYNVAKNKFQITTSAELSQKADIDVFSINLSKSLKNTSATVHLHKDKIATEIEKINDLKSKLMFLDTGYKKTKDQYVLNSKVNKGEAVGKDIVDRLYKSGVIVNQSFKFDLSEFHENISKGHAVDKDIVDRLQKAGLIAKSDKFFKFDFTSAKKSPVDLNIMRYSLRDSLPEGNPGSAFMEYKLSLLFSGQSILFTEEEKELITEHFPKLEKYFKFEAQYDDVKQLFSTSTAEMAEYNLSHIGGMGNLTDYESAIIANMRAGGVPSSLITHGAENRNWFYPQPLGDNMVIIDNAGFIHKLDEKGLMAYANQSNTCSSCLLDMSEQELDDLQNNKDIDISKGIKTKIRNILTMMSNINENIENNALVEEEKNFNDVINPTTAREQIFKNNIQDKSYFNDAEELSVPTSLDYLITPDEIKELVDKGLVAQEQVDIAINPMEVNPALGWRLTESNTYKVDKKLKEKISQLDSLAKNALPFEKQDLINYKIKIGLDALGRKNEIDMTEKKIDKIEKKLLEGKTQEIEGPSPMKR